MASKAVASGPALTAKLLLRLQTHRQYNNPLGLASPLTLASRAFFCTVPPPPPPPPPPPEPLYFPDLDDPNPFLRTGELGPCRVDKTEKECYMRVDVPGIAEDDMKVWTESGFIYFYGKDTKLPEYKYDGRAFGGSISFNPNRYNSNGVKTEVKNGVLWLAIPRVTKE